MAFFDILSYGELAFFVFFCLSALLVIHALLELISRSAALRLRLTEVTAELDLLRPRLPEQTSRVRDLKRQLSPLKRHYQQMLDHYNALLRLERSEGERLEAEQAAALERARLEIRRHEPGAGF